MALEIMNQAAGVNGANGTDKETLYMLGGVALVIFGAGLVLSNSTVRRYLGQLGIGRCRIGGAAGYRTIFPAALDVDVAADKRVPGTS